MARKFKLKGTRLLQRYLLSAVLPYTLLSFLLLTALLFAQQSSRFAEILVSARVPLSLLADFSAALIPSVVVFTLPMAVLAGTVIGFSRLGSDSEMVAIRNSGVSTWSLLWPLLLLGLVASALAGYINFQVAPQSASLIRQAGLEAALTKLNSPIDPRSFSVDIPGYVIYVRDGDKIKGEWGRIFIYNKKKDGSTWVFTAKRGRLDTSGDQSELVLSDTIATQLPASDNADPKQSYVVEHTDTFRVSFDTGRKPLLDKLHEQGDDLDEASFFQLIKIVRSGSPSEVHEAVAYLHKRMALSLAPFLFCLLGTAIGLRVRKGGRALGIFLSIALMLGYYLLSLIGEQTARAGTVSQFVGSWLATAVTLVGSLVLLWVPPGRRLPSFSLRGRFRRSKEKKSTSQPTASSNFFLTGFPSLLDSGVLKSLFATFAVSVVALVGIFLIFTLFELWRYIAATKSGVTLITQYLFFLLPFVVVQITPAAILIAALSTYALMARRSENIAWWASGQSVYRLFAPGVLFAIAVGFGIWYLQESILPMSNMRQDSLRSQLKNPGLPRMVTNTGRQWLASSDSQRLYAFDYIDQPNTVHSLSVFQFDDSGTHLSRILRAENAQWNEKGDIDLQNAEVFTFKSALLEHERSPHFQFENAERFELFKPAIDKPSQLNSQQLSAYIKLNRQRGAAVAALVVALYRKYAEPFGAVVMMMIGAPLELSFGRKNVVAGLCVSILVGVAFWGTSGGFQQLGAFGMLPGAVAAIGPFVIFGSVGLYLLSRTRT